MFSDRNKGRGISGARKMGRLLKHDGITVARCTVERLMRRRGLRGIRHSSSPQGRTRRRPARRTSSDVTSPRRGRTSCGWWTSPTSRPGRGWDSPRSSPTCSPAASWAGGPRTGCQPSCRLMRWRWRYGCEREPERRSPESCITAMRARRDSPQEVCALRWGARAVSTYRYRLDTLR